MWNTIASSMMMVGLMVLPAAAQDGHDAGAKASTHAMKGDAAYVGMMMMHHQMGIEMAGVAAEKGQRAEVKQLATKIATVQQAEKKQLEGYQSRLKSVPPGTGGLARTHDMTGMPAMQKGQQDMERLKKASGSEVDRIFLSSMAKHHQQAVQMSKQAKHTLKDTDVRQFAEKTITNQTKEIAEIRKLQGGSSK